MLSFVCLFGSCSEEKGEGVNAATLEIVDQIVDFDEGGSAKTIAITTNQDEWSATVESSGKSWCTLSPDMNPGNHKLTISVTPNAGKEQRSTAVTVKTAGLSEKITVRQLGTDKGILLSPMMKTVTSEGGKIEFTVTANVEFEITPTVDWITLSTVTRAAEYVTTNHTYFIQRNKGEKRTGSIMVKDKDSDLCSELVISQEAFGTYESQESVFKDDILVPVAKGSGLNRVGEVSQLSTSGFSRAYDGSKETGYHSGDKKSANEDKWPLKFTFEFAEQSSIDYFVYYGGGTEIMRKANIYVSTKEKPEYELLMENVEFTGTVASVGFPTPIIDPLGIRIEALETSGEYVIIKEMEFYRKNPENYNPLELFTDITCTELKSGITEKEINSCPDPLFRNIAYYMFVDEYPGDFRIQNYTAYPHPELFVKENKTKRIHSLLDNPTGIFVKKGEEVVILIGDSYGYSLSTRILNLDVPGDDGFNYNYSYPLVEGINRFKAESDGLLYIYYHTPDYKVAPSIKIHIPSGKVNGYFDSRIHQPSDWNRLLNASVGPHFDVIGEYAHLIYPVSSFKTYTPDGKALIDAYDRLVLLEQQFMGLEKYTRMDPNHICFSVMYNSSYMYSSDAHTGYVVDEMKNLCDVEKFSTSAIWGPAHEVGHSYQTAPGLCWTGMTEVTNNLHSLYVQTEFGNISRLMAEAGTYTSIYEKAMSLCLPSDMAYIRGLNGFDVFCRLVPLWQLHLYSQVEGNSDFYKDLYQKIRETADKDTPGECQLELTVLASEVARLDLTEFFALWGFYEPVDMKINDYVSAQYTVTEDMVKDVKLRIEAMGFPKPTKKPEYICENNLKLYQNSGSIVKGKGTRSGQTFIMKNWQNVAVYEVWSDDKLLFISPASSFTLAPRFELGEKVQVFAVSVSGEKVEVTF